jgi:predicted dehydrogenase
MDALRIGIIGSGFIARTHARSIRDYLAKACLAGIAGGSRAPGLAADFHVPHYDAVESLAGSKEIDAIFITSPHHLHHEHALLCARSGKHVLLEKPTATSLDQCREIRDAYSMRGLRLMIAFSQRFRASNRKAFEIIARGDLGRIRMIQEFALVPDGLAAYPTWQQKPENLGVLFGYGIHNLDKLRWFLQSEVETVSAQAIHAESGIETSTMATMQWRNGAITNLWSSVDLGRPGFEHSAFRSLIVGEKGLLDVDGYGPLRMASTGNAWQTIFVQPPIDWQGEEMFAEARMASFNAQNQEFINAILEGRDPEVTGEDGVRSVEIALALYRAASLNTMVSL